MYVSNIIRLQLFENVLKNLEKKSRDEQVVQYLIKTHVTERFATRKRTLATLDEKARQWEEAEKERRKAEKEPPKPPTPPPEENEEAADGEGGEAEEGAGEEEAG